MSRPSIQVYMMNIAFLTAERSTCARRKVGCIITDAADHIISAGYNGVASGAKHCIDNPCAAATSESGTNLDGCKAIHAEMNAIVHCINPLRAHTLYTTTKPCINCQKLIVAAGITRVYYAEDYPMDTSILIEAGVLVTHMFNRV